MNISVLIIEDSLVDTKILMEHLKRIPSVIKIQTFTSVQDALSDLMEGNYNLLFLDLELPDFSGMDLLQSMPLLPKTVVISANPFYAASIFDMDTVVDFIEKPVTLPRLLRALKRYQEATKPAKVTQLYLKVGRRLQSFKTEEIQYIEADGIYSKVFMIDGSYILVNDNITEIENKLVNTNIVRLHKSYIFNMDLITAFDGRSIWVNELKFSLGVSYRNKLGELLHLDGN